MAKPSRTINKLHFEDLDPGRFETLCLALIHRLKGSQWKELHHHGASGKDDGVDIYGVEVIEAQDIKRERIWFVQAKRYKTISKNSLQKVIDEALDRNNGSPDYFLLITSCNPTKQAVEAYKEYGAKKGIGHVDIWTASTLETRLYNEAQDLLFAYFGISLVANRNYKAESIRRNLRLKKRMLKDFYSPQTNDPHKMNREPYLKYKYDEVIIHSIDDTHYPQIDGDRPGISSWFKTDFYDFYFNGIELWLGAALGYKAVINEKNEWDVLPPLEQNPDPENLHELPIKMIGRIPYEAIIDYDTEGDEYYYDPHIYCDFKFNGEPYEEFRYVKNIPDEYPWELPPENRRNFLK